MYIKLTFINIYLFIFYRYLFLKKINKQTTFILFIFLIIQLISIKIIKFTCFKLFLKIIVILLIKFIKKKTKHRVDV